MDKNTLRRMAGITTVSEQLSAPGYKPSFNASEFRRLAGLPTYPTAIPEAAEEEEKAEEESSEEEVPAEEAKEPSHEEIVAAVAEKAEGKTGEELIAIIKDVYDAGFKDGKESMEEKEEEVKESIAPMGMSDELAAKKIFDKIKGTPNLKLGQVEQMVNKYLSMVGKSANDTKHLTALTASLLKDSGLMD